jgi:hypothetical protein
LDESDASINFFFRDDDAGWANDEFRALLACFRRHSVPIDIAAIPSALTAEFADEICALHDEAPALIGIHQHGFSHTNHEVFGRKCEFGTSRTRQDQYSDIQLGKRKLEAMLGFALDPIFTPPWNRCTEITGECLRVLGFRVLSRDVTARFLALAGLNELPISLDWFAKNNGSRLSFECLGTLIANRVKQRQQPVGIMLHHELMSAEERDLLCDLLVLLSTHRQAHCKLMAEIDVGSATVRSSFELEQSVRSVRTDKEL